jgi:hypothetical protein
MMIIELEIPEIQFKNNATCQLFKFMLPSLMNKLLKFDGFVTEGKSQ